MRLDGVRRCYDSRVPRETAAVLLDEIRKDTGAYYTPPDAVRALVSWATRNASERMLDPSCGDGRFLAAHDNAFGVEQDPSSYAIACQRAPWATIHHGDFFEWAASTRERFECAAGNPPFIRYQRFTGLTRSRALRFCASLGANFSALTSSWAPFLVATAGLLKRGGRMAFVVPSEIGHAPYAAPLLRFLAERFATIQLIAVREKIFSDLSEDTWLLFADGYGGHTDGFNLTATDHFEFSDTPPNATVRVSLRDWETWHQRLRPFLLSTRVRDFYCSVIAAASVRRLGSLAKVGIGYVTGANDFFHLRPSEARAASIPSRLLHPAVRNGRSLTGKSVTAGTVRTWIRNDEPVLLLRLDAGTRVTGPIKKYLNSQAGYSARKTYKCRNRSPWYVVPDVTVPHAFLSYMSSNGPTLAANRAGCVGTNSVHAVNIISDWSLTRLQRAWDDPFTSLSCETEGHPLGGGMLKLEPGEAVRVAMVSDRQWANEERYLIDEGVRTLRQWRHCNG